jgi:hypothetical protein
MAYVGDFAFENASSLHTVSFANGDEGNLEFGNYVFSECKNLVTVNLPKSVTKLNLGVFDGCVNISEIKVDAANDYYKDEDGVVLTKDGKELLFFPKGRKTATGEYVIPQGVESISNGAFRGMRFISKIQINNTITYIGKNAFGDCGSLVNLTFEAGNETAMLNIDDEAFKAYKDYYGQANYEQIESEYGETNIRAALQADRLFDYLLNTKLEKSDAEDEHAHAETVYENGKLAFYNIGYTIKADTDADADKDSADK